MTNSFKTQYRCGPDSESHLSTDNKPGPCSNGRDQILKTPPTHNNGFAQHPPTDEKPTHNGAAHSLNVRLHREICFSGAELEVRILTELATE